MNLIFIFSCHVYAFALMSEYQYEHQGNIMKSKWLKILNPILGLAFVFQISVGFSGDFIPNRTFERLHEIGAIVLLICVIAHIYLNWQWIRVNYFNK